ncbi:MAG TPA: ATP-binding protein [Pyrinomonadaceae bacterium]|jgi:serine/threonine-protein kinase RsbW|nr:ATP-binding protein [Pyrinomonadaceae bacterium]
MQRKILIIDDHDDLATSLHEVFTHVGHFVHVVIDRREALAIENIEEFDLVITDLDVENFSPEMGLNGNAAVCLPTSLDAEDYGTHIKAFKICAANFRRDEFDEEELKNLVATVLDYKIRYVDTKDIVQQLHENIEFELPSAISLMHIVLEYLMKRVEKLGVIKPEQSNLFVALDEAFVNAVKHGNKFDARKLVRITAEVSQAEARFTIEDEGEGFDVQNIPDPLDPENLFKTSGRGVLFIYNIMDEVKYNDRGNRLTMVKKGPAEEEHNA